MGCGITTVKHLLFFFNFVFALCGLAMLIAGALTYANIDKSNYFMEEVSEKVNFTASPIALMVVGSIIFVIAFFGCCGAIRESNCMIITFAVLLLAILIMEIAIRIVVFVRSEEGWEQTLRNTDH
jgi:CD63 antigen